MRLNDKGIVPFGHLHVHSEFSLRDSPAKIKELVRKMPELGMNFIALTEHGNMHSVMEFYNSCIATGKALIQPVGEKLGVDKAILKKIAELIPKGKSVERALEEVEELKDYESKYPKLLEEVVLREVKPILGVEAYIIPTKEMVDSADKAINTTRYHLTLLAKNENGYKRLIKAVSESYLYQHKTPRSVFPRMTYELMEKYLGYGDIIALSGCIQGEIPRCILEGDIEKAKEKIEYYQSIFGKENFYIELQNHGLSEELEILPHLVALGKETGAPFAATNDVHYVEKEGARVRDMVVAMRFNTSITDPEFEDDCGELHAKSYEEMLELFKDIPEALTNTVKIAKECSYNFEKRKKFPKFDVPGGKTEEEYIVELAKEGIYKRYPDFDGWKEIHKKTLLDRLDRELETINKLHYAGYHLIVQDFINEGKKVGLVGPGRGSAVGSLVCYLLGITDVSPLKYDLIFERFLNEERISDPDIDTDFGSNRDYVIDYVRKKYGQNAVCNIVTFGTLAARAAIRSAGRVTGKPLSICDRVAKMVPNRPGISIKEALEANPELKEEYTNEKEVGDLIDDALLLEGLVVHTGIHAAGIIIADRDISDYIPIMYDKKEDTWVTQLDMKQCEAEGLLKMDFLGLENLTIIEKTIEGINENYGYKVSLQDIDFNNKEEVREVISSIFAKGNTKAIFQFESSGMRNLLKKFQPSSIEDLILLNAAYRPGPLQYLDEIIGVKHGRRVVSYICPRTKDILELTYGRPIYQEQIMRMFHEIGGFSLGESDIIRRAMSKKYLDELEVYLPKFKEQLIAAGTNAEKAEQFCEELIEFANYAFNKSHSAAYAVIAYYTAWFKHFYPEEYMASVLSSASSDKLPFCIKECKDMGIEVLPPSVNESGESFTAVKKGVIRFGLAGVKNVGKACNKIIEVRKKNGKFRSLKGFVDTMVVEAPSSLNKRVVDSLIMTGCFDEFGLNRRQMMDGCMGYIKNLKDYIKKKNNPKSRESTIERAKAKIELPYFDLTTSEYSKDFILENEKNLIGFYASGHPLDAYSWALEEHSDTVIGDIGEDSNDNYVTLVGQITSFQPLFRKSDGEAMGKFVLEDLTGEIDCICFTKAFKECKDNIEEGAVIVLKGRIMAEVERDEETGEITNSEIQVVVSDVMPIKARHKVYVRLSTVFDWMDKIRPIFKEFPGEDPLFVYFEKEDEIMEVKHRVNSTSEELTSKLAEVLGRKKITIVKEGA